MAMTRSRFTWFRDEGESKRRTINKAVRWAGFLDVESSTKILECHMQGKCLQDNPVSGTGAPIGQTDLKGLQPTNQNIDFVPIWPGLHKTTFQLRTSLINH